MTLPYEAAMHGVQTGIAYKIEMAPDEAGASPKHLRVGIDSAMVSDAALVRLLVKKGLITHEEYMEELTLEANRELERYEEWFRARGMRVTLR